MLPVTLFLTKNVINKNLCNFKSNYNGEQVHFSLQYLKIITWNFPRNFQILFHKHKGKKKQK